jgi:hypothetical protein
MASLSYHCIILTWLCFKLSCSIGFSKENRLTVDASDVGVGAVLLQEGKDDIDLPNCYFSLKYDKDQKK